MATRAFAIAAKPDPQVITRMAGWDFFMAVVEGRNVVLEPVEPDPNSPSR